MPEQTEAWYADQTPAVARTHRTLSDQARGSHLHLLDTIDRLQDLQRRKAELQTRKASFDPRVAGAAAALIDREIAVIDPEIHRLQGVQADQEAVWRAYRGVLTGCDEWLKAHGGGHYRDAPLPVVERPAGGYAQGVEEQRQALANCHEDHAEVESAGNDVAEMVEQIKARFAKLREKGRPDISYLLRPGGSVDDIRWPLTSIESYDGGSRFRSNSQDAIAIVAALPKAGAELEAAVIAAIEAEAARHDGETLTDAERKRRLAEIEAERLEIERVEEAMIRAAEAEGLEILRRPDADPRAVLSVEACAAAGGE